MIRKIALTGGIATGKTYVASQLTRSRRPDGGRRRAGARSGGAGNAGPGRDPQALRSRCGAARRHHGSRARRADRLQGQARAARSRSHHPSRRSSRRSTISSPTLPKRTPFAVADIPLVFETGRDKEFDAVVVVACPREMQLQRLMERNKLSKEDAERRLAAQLPIDQKVKKATYVIEQRRHLRRDRRAGRRSDQEAAAK